jgi:hypothetical protein
MISWWSKYVGVVLSVLMYDIRINVLLFISELVGPLHNVDYNVLIHIDNFKTKNYILSLKC